MSKKEWLILGCILAVALGFRWWNVGVPSLNGDEGDNFDSFLDITERGISPWQRWAGLLPPVSLWVMTAFMWLAGPSEFGLRLHAVIVGTLTVGIIYALGRLQYGVRVAQGAALLAAVLPLLVLSNRDAHPDSVLVFFSVLTILLCEFGRKYNSNKVYWCAGIASGLAIISKNNAVFLMGWYWLFRILSVIKKPRGVGKDDDLRKVIWHVGQVALAASVVILFSFGFNPKNVIYFGHGVLFWIFNQNVDVTAPWYYSLSILFDGLSPLVFLWLPIVGVMLFRKRNRNDLLNIVLCFFFLIMVALQGRKFPRHFLLAMPFAALLISNSLMVVARYKKSKILAGVLAVLILISAAGWSGYKIKEYQEYTVWREVGQFVLKNSPEKSVVFVHGVEYWTVRFYTEYKRKIVSRLQSDLLVPGDVVILHNLNKKTRFFIGSPLQNDLTVYSPQYAEQYKFNDEFYAFVRKYGQLLKKFKYDELGNEIIVYKMGYVKNPQKENKIAKEFVLDPMTQRICDIWKSEGKIKNILKKIIPLEIQEQMATKCTKGCVVMCGIF